MVVQIFIIDIIVLMEASSIAIIVADTSSIPKMIDLMRMNARHVEVQTQFITTTVQSIIIAMIVALVGRRRDLLCKIYDRSLKYLRILELMLI